MINPVNHLSRHSVRTVAGLGCLAGVVAMTALGGCAAEEEPIVQAPVAPKPPPPPPAPTVTSIAKLKERLKIDDRIELPEDKAPPTDSQRIAVLEFFDSFARGDDRSLSGMLSVADTFELQALVNNGQWASQVEQINQVDLQTGDSAYGYCALALFHVDGNYQPQLWYMRGDDEVTFEAAPTPPGILQRLYGEDWIKAWHEILEEELALADQPDDDVEIPQIVLDTDDGGSSAAGGGPGGTPSSPGSPGGTKPGRRPPPTNPRKPPGG